MTEPGRLEELWADRRSVAESLGHWLGGFDEVAWQAPNTFIGFYDGPIKVDFLVRRAAGLGPEVPPAARHGNVKPMLRVPGRICKREWGRKRNTAA